MLFPYSGAGFFQLRFLGEKSRGGMYNASMQTTIRNPEFKVTKTSNIALLRSVRWTRGHVRMTGWDIVGRLAAGIRTHVSEFVVRYSPGVYSDHAEFTADNWRRIETEYVD